MLKHLILLVFYTISPPTADAAVRCYGLGYAEMTQQQFAKSAPGLLEVLNPKTNREQLENVDLNMIAARFARQTRNVIYQALAREILDLIAMHPAANTETYANVNAAIASRYLNIRPTQAFFEKVLNRPNLTSESLTAIAKSMKNGRNQLTDVGKLVDTVLTNRRMSRVAFNQLSDMVARHVQVERADGSSSRIESSQSYFGAEYSRQPQKMSEAQVSELFLKLVDRPNQYENFMPVLESMASVKFESGQSYMEGLPQAYATVRGKLGDFYPSQWAPAILKMFETHPSLPNIKSDLNHLAEYVQKNGSKELKAELQPRIKALQAEL